MLSIKRIEAANGAFLQLQYAVGNPTDHVLTARLALTQEQLPEITTEELQRTDRIYVLVGKFKEDAGVLNLQGTKPIFPQIVPVDIEYRNDENKVADFMARLNLESFFKLMFDNFITLIYEKRSAELMDIANLQIVFDPIDKVILGAFDHYGVPSKLVTRNVLKQLGCTTDNIPVPYVIDYRSGFDVDEPFMQFEFGDGAIYVNVTPTKYADAVRNLPGVFPERRMVDIAYRFGVFNHCYFNPTHPEKTLFVPGLGNCRIQHHHGSRIYLGYVYEKES